MVDRSEFMMEMKLALSNLITSQMKITELKEQQETLIGSAKTRLKWAAGSNPALNEVLMKMSHWKRNKNAINRKQFDNFSWRTRFR